MLLKVALLVGIEIHVNVEFKGLIEPPEDQESESKPVRMTARPPFSWATLLNRGSSLKGICKPAFNDTPLSPRVIKPQITKTREEHLKALAILVQK